METLQAVAFLSTKREDAQRYVAPLLDDRSLRFGRPTPRAERSSTSLVHLLGWRVYHTWDSRKSEPDFPDLVLVRDRVMFAELQVTSRAVAEGPSRLAVRQPSGRRRGRTCGGRMDRNALGEIGAWNR
jgi:hypothetical protein